MIRTYSRKRPHNQLIEDVHELCRLCLNKAIEVMPIFSNDTEDICATLALRIMICVGLEVTREECLPNIICTECYDELNKYYTFRKKCEVTYQKLKSHVLAVKEKEYKQKLLLNKKESSKEKIKDEDGMKFVVTFDKDQFTEVNVLNLNGVAQVNSFADKLPNISPVKSTDNNMSDLHNTAVQQSKVDNSDPDITTFLSTMLIELGVLTQQEDGLEYSNQNIKTLELEMGDGSQVTLDLMEEDAVQDQNMPETRDTPEKLDTSEAIKENSEENEMVIQYITSNARIKNDDLVDKKLVGTFCEECGKRFASKSALSRHMRIHSGEKPYACVECGRRFAQREVMLRHMLVHKEHRPYNCSECDKSFTQRGALASHVRAHAPPNARPLALHRCDRCPKVFLYASGLSRHMMMHNGRVYVCGACERQFRDKSSLLRHLKNANHAPRDNAPT